jgi:pyruvate/2-oxoglutarate dehydrogenase complex dihydrolipoamide acyltransferase (E2) component
MESTQTPEQAGAPDVRVAQADEKLPSDYEKIVREELVRVQERLAKLAPAGEPGSLEPTIAAFRPAAVNDIKVAPDDRPAPKSGVVRGLMGFVTAACIAGGAIAWQSSYGEEAKRMIAAWAPQLGSTSSPQTEQTGLPAQQVAAADTAAPQPPPTAEAAPPDAAATTASAPPDLSESLQTMARDIAGLQQAVDQLKAGQDQMVRDNARVAEQLRASQEQMTRLLAKASEQNLHAKTAAPPRPIAAPMRRPVATLPPPPQPMPPPQAAPPPQLAAQPQAEAADLPTVPRPPKPVP